MKTLTLQTKARTHFMDITSEVEKFRQEQSLKEGLITLFVPHTTAGITVNENADLAVVSDIKTVLNHLIPWQNDYLHQEGNSAAHVKASLMGSSAQVLVENERLCLGTWQSLYFCEFDGPRTRQVWLKESCS